MDSSPQNLSTYTFLWDADKLSKNGSDEGQGRFGLLWQAQKEFFRTAAEASLSAKRKILSRLHHTVFLSTLIVVPRVLAVWQEVHPVLAAHSRKLFPFLAPAKTAPESEEPDIVHAILSEFECLGQDQQDKVAKNLALLWHNFQDMFGGISGFLAAPHTEQEIFMERLQAAVDRMETARGSQVAFHYVTVELMRQYISFFLIGRADQKTISLAACVVSLIDRGSHMTASSITYSVKA
jgi:hypothetical protein